VTPAQCRAARAFIAMSQNDLARAAVVPMALVTDFETGILTPRPADLDALQHALERAGVEFTNGGQPGVRLKGPSGTIPADQLNASNDE
jgi:predicted transcriptional regulator